MSLPNSVTLIDENGLLRAAFNPTSKTIADSAATPLFDVICPVGGLCGGFVFFSIHADDGTDFQSMTGMVSYASVNKAGTQTLAITNASGNDAKAASSGTLTLSWTFVTGTGKSTVKIQPTGSLTEVVYTIKFTVFPLRGQISIL